MSPRGRCRCGCLVEHHDVATPSPGLFTCRGCDELCIVHVCARPPQPGRGAVSAAQRWIDLETERFLRFVGFAWYRGAHREHTD